MSLKTVLNEVSSQAEQSSAAQFKSPTAFNRDKSKERVVFNDFSENGESEDKPVLKKKEKGEESVVRAREEAPELKEAQKESPEVEAKEEKPWYENVKKDEVDNWKKSFDTFTQRSQELAEEKKKFYSEKEEFEKGKKAAEDEKFNSKVKEFKNLSLDERTELLHEAFIRSADSNKTSPHAKEIEALKAELHSIKVERFKEDIRGALRKAEKDPEMEVKDEYLYKVNEAYFNLTGQHIANKEQFLFAHNSFKNRFSDELVKKAKAEGIKEGRKEVEEGIKRVELTTAAGKPGAPKSKAVHEMDVDERRAAMLADPDVMKAGHYKFEMRRRK